MFSIANMAADTDILGSQNKLCHLRDLLPVASTCTDSNFPWIVPYGDIKIVLNLFIWMMLLNFLFLF
jgi:hypothetical protein